MTCGELKRLLKKQGCRFEAHGKNHDWWINRKNGNVFQIPRHESQEMKTKTVQAILKEAGLN